MAEKLITIKSPIRTLRETDDLSEIIRKMNQNTTNLWNIINNQEARIKELENNRYIEYVKRDVNSIIVRTSQGNKKIQLES
jgi:hypothetical protein|tara:strand:+ start:9212 stop:9454 length:243 start_codon:yes stop_codon:yes gene_type:complete